MTPEIWKELPYAPKYSISNKGGFRSSHRKGRGKPHLQTMPTGKPGYLKVWICGINKFKSLHRLVAELFIPNPQQLPEVNHIDGNKLNNDVSNLEWCTHRKNIMHAHQNGLWKRKNKTK